MLFRNSFEAAEALDAELPLTRPAAALTVGGAPLRIVLPDTPTTRLIDTLSVARASDGSGFRIERLNDVEPRLRLVAVDRDGRERISAWQTIVPGTDFTLDVIDAEDGSYRVRLDGGAWMLALALDAISGVSSYEMRTTGEE